MISMATDKPKFLVAHMLRSERIGTELPGGKDMPLHTALIPPVPCEYDPKLGLEQITSQHDPLWLVMGERAMFGANHDIEAKVVRMDKRVHRLRSAMIERIEFITGLDVDNNEGYSPHILTYGKRVPHKYDLMDSLTVLEGKDNKDWIVRENLGFKRPY